MLPCEFLQSLLIAAFIYNFEYIWLIYLVFLLITLSMHLSDNYLPFLSVNGIIFLHDAWRFLYYLAFSFSIIQLSSAHNTFLKKVITLKCDPSEFLCECYTGKIFLRAKRHILLISKKIYPSWTLLLYSCGQ